MQMSAFGGGVVTCSVTRSRRGLSDNKCHHFCKKLRTFKSESFNLNLKRHHG